jgi:glutamate-ammonia-ligase adenylyltransferase
LCSAATWTTACSIAAQPAPPDPRPRRQAQRRPPERANDVKLSRGGIREIEFTVQLLQVVRGGQFPSCAPPHAGGLQRLAPPA